MFSSIRAWPMSRMDGPQCFGFVDCQETEEPPPCEQVVTLCGLGQARTGRIAEGIIARHGPLAEQPVGCRPLAIGEVQPRFRSGHRVDLLAIDASDHGLSGSTWILEVS